MNSAFERAIAAFEPAHWPLAVGFSGGADSTALLAACAARWPGQVVAFHVHHGLQAAADGFEQHCRSMCERLGVPLVVHRVDARHAAGESPEDAARRARYAAFAEMAQLEVPIIVTIIGEGGSGGALAISVGDQLLMLQYSIYSVISPEAALPSSGRQARRRRKQPMRWALPRTASRRWAWSTRS